jgi:hypothetical protein
MMCHAMRVGFVRERPAWFAGVACRSTGQKKSEHCADAGGPNPSSVSNQTWPVPRVEKRSGALLDRLGRVRLKSTKLQIELNGDSSQTDFATET